MVWFQVAVLFRLSSCAGFHTLLFFVVLGDSTQDEQLIEKETF